MQAILVLFLWGFVHFTYIVNAEDCLGNITERPFPHDVILQVEAYSNASEIWDAREKALRHKYNQLYFSDIESQTGGVNSEELNTTWTRDYCESNFIVNLTGTNYFCQMILLELFTNSEKNINSRSTEDIDGSMDSPLVKNTCAQINFNQWIENKNNICYQPGTDAGDFSVEEEYIKTAFYSKNHTLFNLFDHHSKCLSSIVCVGQ